MFVVKYELFQSRAEGKKSNYSFSSHVINFLLKKFLAFSHKFKKIELIRIYASWLLFKEPYALNDQSLITFVKDIQDWLKSLKVHDKNKLADIDGILTFGLSIIHKK